ncbi:hypothetical protein C8F04DRAFT_180931 [Mycena alexandri]|uniref:Uncharacterized protein n=1 Tax=Mycena alexandri TaxID=1745969 RepID=A0AAD6S946_9AGAR|nr:hypothetical protein C8F04DRAFT_180931 [Mycena alexandri]
MRHLSTSPGLSSTQEHSHTSDALPARTGSQTRSATGMRGARRLKHHDQEARRVPLRRSSPYVRRAGPSTARLPRVWRMPSTGTKAVAGLGSSTPHMVSHATTNALHGAHNVLRNCDVASCTLSRSERHTTLARSTPCRWAPYPRPTPPAVREARDARVQCAPPPSLRPRAAQPSLPHRSTPVARRITYTTRTSPTHALPPSARRQVLSRSASMRRAIASVRSTRCSCSPKPRHFRPVCIDAPIATATDALSAGWTCPPRRVMRGALH